MVLPGPRPARGARRRRRSRRSSARSASAPCSTTWSPSRGPACRAHQATHVGTGLANGHSSAARDFETIRSRARGREALVDELAGAAIAGLPHAQALLARAISPYDDGVREACEAATAPDPEAIRKAVLTAVGGRTQWMPAGAARMSDGGLSSVGNAARLLKAFLSREKEIGVSELARRLDLGKSTVHRLLTTLVQEGLVERNPDTGAYRLGLTMFELGQVVQSHMDLHGAVGPVLAALREETHEGCQVGVLDGHEVVYIDRLESSQTLRLFNETGRRVPVHTTSSGKVLLAHLTEPELERVLAAASPLAQMTPRSITDPAVLRTELARIRARGWSEAVEEREIGVASIAAPIRDAAGRVVAAISIGGPAARMGAQQRRRLAEVVVEAGEAASRRLGWSPETRHLREG